MLVTSAGTTLLWDLASGKSTEVGEGLAEPLMFSADGKSLLLSRDTAREIQIYDLASGENIIRTQNGAGQFLAMSPDGKTQVVWKNMVLMRSLVTPYDVTTGKAPIPLTGSSVRNLLLGRDTVSLTGSRLHPLQFSSDGKTLVIKDEHHNFMLWDVASGKSTTVPDSNGVWFALSPDGKTVVAQCGTKGFQLFDLITGKRIAGLENDRNDPPFTLMVFSPDSKIIASGSVYTIKLWSATTGKTIATLETTARFEKGRHMGSSGMIGEVSFTPDGKTLVARWSNVSFQFWNVPSRKVISSLPMESPLLAFSPDGTTLATGSKDGKIRLWDMPDRNGGR